MCEPKTIGARRGLRDIKDDRVLSSVLYFHAEPKGFSGFRLRVADHGDGLRAQLAEDHGVERLSPHADGGGVGAVIPMAVRDEDQIDGGRPLHFRDGCWCDDACEDFGDCCEDKATVSADRWPFQWLATPRTGEIAWVPGRCAS